MIKRTQPNIGIIEKAVSLLGPLADEMVFIGGCATGLLITDPAAPPIRPTIDVDVLVEVSSLASYHILSEKLRKKGFSEDLRPDAPICRWKMKTVILDVMPTNPDILGFGNRWYKPAFKAAKWLSLPSGAEIRILPAPYFLATKFEAFDGRGQGDYLMSPDMEDVIAVIDGRNEIVEEISKTDSGLKAYIKERMALLLENRLFLESLSGHLPPDPQSQARADSIIEKMRQIITSKEGLT